MNRDYECNFKLMPLQPKVMDAVFDCFNRKKNRVMVISPTGSGKTVMMGGISKYYMKKKPKDIVLIISHLGLLVSQSGDSFRKFWSMGSDILQGKKLPSPNARCILSTIQSSSVLTKAYTWIQSLPEDVKVGLIQIDEVHINSGTERVDKLITKFFPDAKVVGYTGSPFKDNKDMSGLFDEIAYSVSLQEAISMGILVPPRMHTMQVDKKDVEDVMAKCISTVKASHINDRCIVFMRTIVDADLMCDMFIKLGFTCASVTSKLVGDDRDSLLKMVREDHKDSPQILVTVDVLSVGFDAPSLKAIIMPYGTGSVSQYLQRIGRGLRTWRNKKHCDIYIGGVDPKIERKQWERVQRKVLLAGGSEPVTPEETTEQIAEKVLTLAMVKMTNSLKKRNMDELASMLESRSFPSEMMTHLATLQPVKSFGPRSIVSEAQLKLIRSRNIEASSYMTKNEAATIIDAIATTEGWKKPEAIMPKGRFKGEPLSRVPHTYQRMVRNPNGKYYDAELATLFTRRGK